MQQDIFDVIVVGELNVDLILNDINGFPELHKEKLASQLTLTLGSSAAIFASNLSSLNTSVSFIGKIGKDYFGEMVLDSLKDKNVNTDFIVIDKALTTGVTVALNYVQERAGITHQGAMTELGIDDITDDQLAQARHLHFSSYFLQPKIAKDLHVLMKRAKDLGLTTSLDPQWDPHEKWDMNLEKILPHVDVFLPNELELRFLSGSENWKKSVNQLSKIGNSIVVKLGSNGSGFFEDGQIELVEPYQNENIVDAIGAGDSFNAGFIKKFIEGAPLKECARFGNLMGALSTTSSGGTGAFTDWKALSETAEKKFNTKMVDDYL